MTGLLIVIPCLNEAAHLGGLLDQFCARASPDDLIVVADGGSTDGSQQVVTQRAALEANIRLLHNPGRLQSAGVNAAVRAFGDGREYLVRVDAHARYPDGYAGALADAARRRQAHSVVVPMRTVFDTCFQQAAATAQNSRIGTGGAAHRMGGEGGWVDHGHHALMRLDLFRAVGGYDERFSHNEDAELDIRLVKSGGRIWLEAVMAIDYLPRRSLGPLFRQYLNYGRGRARTLRLHRKNLRPRQALPVLVLPAVLAGAAGASLVALHPLSAILALPALAWMAACVIGGLAAGTAAGGGTCALMSGWLAMTMHLGWSIGFWRELVLERALMAKPAPDL